MCIYYVFVFLRAVFTSCFLILWDHISYVPPLGSGGDDGEDEDEDYLPTIDDEAWKKVPVYSRSLPCQRLRRAHACPHACPRACPRLSVSFF